MQHNQTVRRRLQNGKGYLYLAPSLIILLVFTIYPLIKAFMMSFCEDYSIINGSFKGVNLQNYQDLFADDVFLKALSNTSIYVVFVVPVSILLSLVIAVLIHNAARGKAIFQTLYFLPYVTSVIAIGIVWSWIFNSNYGLLNYFLSLFGIDAIPWLNDPQYALAALIIFSIWKSLAFNILIFLSGIIVYAFLMGLINAFKVYNEVFSLFQSKAGPANSAITVVYYIYDKFYNSGDYGVASAAAVVLFIIILVLTMVQKFIAKEKEAA